MKCQDCNCEATQIGFYGVNDRIAHRIAVCDGHALPTEYKSIPQLGYMEAEVAEEIPMGDLEYSKNPRNLPCPNCGEKNRLTHDDRAIGRECDSCRDEDGGY
jgi:protein-arginine kinase activator protein McsA